MSEEKLVSVRHYDNKKHFSWCRGQALCLCGRSVEDLGKETACLSRKPESPLGGAIADILLITIFKKNIKGNDNYMLERRSSKTHFLDIHRVKGPETNAKTKI